MNTYKVLNKQVFSEGNFSIVPIRFEDRMAIMKWRNEQLYHLRQQKPLTEEDQDNYFYNIVSKLFEQEQPIQILFSFLENNICIGYGGLVHINWIDKNAEISFVMNTQLEKQYFTKYWSIYLRLIEEVAFSQLNFHKIFTYAFDLRPHLYVVLEQSGYVKEAVLKEHCFFDGKYKDVIIHSKKSNDAMKLYSVKPDDAKLLFDWANEPEVRANSLNSEPIQWDNHLKWFTNKLNSESKMYILYDNTIPIGQIRFDFFDDNWVIDYSIDKKYRGKGFGKMMLELAIRNFNQGDILKAIVKKENLSSLKIFQKLGFEEQIEVNLDVYCLIKKVS